MSPTITLVDNVACAIWLTGVELGHRGTQGGVVPCGGPSIQLSGGMNEGLNRCQPPVYGRLEIVSETDVF